MWLWLPQWREYRGNDAAWLLRFDHYGRDGFCLVITMLWESPNWPLGRHHVERKRMPPAGSQHQPPNMHVAFQSQLQVEQKQTCSTVPVILIHRPGSLINACFIPPSVGVKCNICYKTLKYYIFHLLVVFIVYFFPPESKLHKGKDFYLFGLLVHARC